MGRHVGRGHVLRARFAKGVRERRRSVRIEKIVKRKGDKVLVRWKGWPVKYDSWVDKKGLYVTKKPRQK